MIKFRWYIPTCHLPQVSLKMLTLYFFYWASASQSIRSFNAAVFGNKFFFFLNFCPKLRYSRVLVLKSGFATKDSLRFLSLTWLREGCCCETLETPRVLNWVLFSSTLTCVGSHWRSFSPHECDETASTQWAPVFVHVTRILPPV